jgi:hypothetical protein
MKIWSYRDELGSQQPERVNDEFFGGAYGCPGCYFDGAPIDDHLSGGKKCRPLSTTRCRDCWDKPYQQERRRQDDN